MSRIIDALSAQAYARPAAPAVSGSVSTISYAELEGRVRAAVKILDDLRPSSLALIADNCVDWIVADLASLHCGITVVPVPLFFTPPQVAHILESASVDCIVADAASAGFELGLTGPVASIGALAVFRRPADRERSAGPAQCAKITYTSGSTGAPRGVCLSRRHLEDVTRRLATQFADLHIRRHLCSMPLATLLENVAGVYVPLTLGTTISVPPLHRLGLYGSSRIDAARFRRMIHTTGAESLILLPQVLRELTHEARCSGEAPSTLRYIAVGGARVAPADIVAARQAGIPAYQGYGLSECGSVVAINTPDSHRDDSVGRPLPGIRIEISDEGEILVHGQGMVGYVDAAPVAGAIATGDLGHVDADGFLHVTGRRKNVFITGFGRNVSPEWPESELLHQRGVVQACVYGEERAGNVAVLYVDPARLEAGDIDRAIERANAHLPDYARVSEWILAKEPFSAANGLLTAGGKLRRDAIARHYLATVTACVKREPLHA